jgi:PhnB protein
MTDQQPTEMPRITAYLYYEDLRGSVDWLVKAFGFQERKDHAVTMPDGTLGHTEIQLGKDGVVMMGHPGPDYQNPRRQKNSVSQLYVYVDDVEAHSAHAKASGAEISTELEETFYGDRRYTAIDPEGFEWTFATKMRDVAPADWDVAGSQ